ncbi:MAG: hypothetical protein ACT4OX_00135 [Actinomycetota bacterium]
MTRSGYQQRRGLRAFVLGMMAAMLALAACGGDDDDAEEEPSEEVDPDDDTDATDGEEDEALTASATGLTETALKLGVTLVDYEAIAFAVDFNRGDQEAVVQTLIDWMNEEKDGIGGRQIEPVYQLYPPIPGMTPSPLDICTRFTDDEQVWAVIGVFIDFSGEGQLCLTRDKRTIHIGHELEQPWIDQAEPALLLGTGTTADRTAADLIALLGEEGTLDGKTVAILGDQDAQSRIDDTITPALEELGVELGSTAVLNIVDEDTTAAQAQLDGFIERWETEGVDTIFYAGLRASAKQFAEKIKAAFPDVLVVTDSTSLALQAQDEVVAGTDPNPYEGLLTIEGQTRSERWAAPNALLQECIDAYESRTGETILGPDELQPGPDGKTTETYVIVEDTCDELVLLKLGTEAAGRNPTIESWQEAINSLGPIELPTADIASLCEGKYTANDAARLVEFDETIGEKGDWSGITEMIDSSGGRCA